MKKNLLIAGAAFGLLAVVVSLSIRQAHGQDAAAAVPVTTTDFVAPGVFQAAGPSKASIQSSVDEYRAKLGDNRNNDGPHDDGGRREINWDGRDVVTTGPSFDGFLITRGALFTTP